MVCKEGKEQGVNAAQLAPRYPQGWLVRLVARVSEWPDLSITATHQPVQVCTHQQVPLPLPAEYTGGA